MSRPRCRCRPAPRRTGRLAVNILILYDSRFGNTHRLADAMGSAISSEHSVTTRAISGVPTDAAWFDLVLVGGPTHAHGASASLKEALQQLPKGSLAGVHAAVFDTRFRMPKVLSGSAAQAAAKLLRRAGAEVVDPVESFFVTRATPPELDPGEDTRAAAWAHHIVAWVSPQWAAPV